MLRLQAAAKAAGFSDVVYLDAVHDRFLEEVSSCNIFIVSGTTIRTPALKARSPPDPPGCGLQRQGSSSGRVQTVRTAQQ